MTVKVKEAFLKIQLTVCIPKLLNLQKNTVVNLAPENILRYALSVVSCRAD